ncbi:MAG: hypothetical protein IJ418_09705 [Clostridia bacterium]|nr:hypothetical protein [Clostridia bacterium]
MEHLIDFFAKNSLLGEKITPLLKQQKAQKPCVYKVSEPLKYKKIHHPVCIKNWVMMWWSIGESNP